MKNQKHWSYAAAAALSLLVALSGCASSTATWVELKGQRYQVEIADDFDSRARGLMFRDQLPADQGMLFIYDREQPSAFWMKNTRIPLDILYFNGQQRLVHAQTGVPPCSLGNGCPSYPSPHPAMYVLELAAGQANALQLKAGDVITFSPDIPLSGKP